MRKRGLRYFRPRPVVSVRARRIATSSSFHATPNTDTLLPQSSSLPPFCSCYKVCCFLASLGTPPSPRLFSSQSLDPHGILTSPSLIIVFWVNFNPIHSFTFPHRTHLIVVPIATASLGQFLLTYSHSHLVRLSNHHEIICVG